MVMGHNDTLNNVSRCEKIAQQAAVKDTSVVTVQGTKSKCSQRE